MVYELRQYTLRPGRRDVLVELFERELIEGQERAGMRILGQFHDLADPDRFVWMRWFTGMPERAAALAAFYDGPVWQAHREAANATMLDSDDVLLLRAAGDESGLLGPARRPPVGAAAVPPSVYVATLHSFDAAVPDGFARLAEHAGTGGGTLVGLLRTEYAENTFPRLPVRTGEHVFVSLMRFPDAARAAEHAGRLVLAEPAEQLFLAPTARSLLR